MPFLKCFRTFQKCKVQSQVKLVILDKKMKSASEKRFCMGKYCYFISTLAILRVNGL